MKPFHSAEKQDLIIRQMFLKLFPAQLLTLLMPQLGNLVSSLLIGNFLPQLALTAVGFTVSFRLVTSALSFAVTCGSNILCGRALGRCDTEDMNRIFSVCMTLLFGFGVVLTFVGLAFAPQIAALLGAAGEALTLTALYIRSMAIGYIPMMLIYGLMVFLPIANDAMYAMFSSAVLAATTLLFGYLNAKVFNGGIFGMGLANSLGQFVTLAFLLTRFLFNKSLMRFRINGRFLETAGRIVRLGISASVNQLTGAVSGFIIVSLITRFGGNVAVAAFGITGPIQGFFNAISASIGRTCTSIFSLYVDPKDADAQKRVLRCATGFGAVITLVASSLLLLLAKPISCLMGAEGEVLATSVLRLRIFFGYLIVILPERILTSAHDCLGHIRIQNIDDLFTNCVFPVFFSYSLGTLFGINGLWYCWIISDLLSLLIYYIYAWKARKAPPKSFWDMCLTERTVDYGVRMNHTVHTMEEVVRISQSAIAFCRRNGIDAKRSYLCGLCLEELSGNIITHGFPKSDRPDKSIDVYLFISNGEILVRICDNAPGFDPMVKLGSTDVTDPLKNFGIRMVRRLAKTMAYKPTYGMNVISITL